MRFSAPPTSRPETHNIVCYKKYADSNKKTFKSCSAFSSLEFMRKLVPCERGRDSERPFAKLQSRPRDDIITAG